MATVTVTDDNRVLEDPQEISSFLARYGIWYRRFEKLNEIGDDATDEQILAAFGEPIKEQMEQGGYVTADVIEIKSQTPEVLTMLARFSKEHWHSEDEVRFVVRGRGIFHIHPPDEPVFRIQVVAGDMINVPEGTRHWFDLCDEKQIRCIRLFQDPAGWTPHYTESGEEARHEPVCLGPAFIPGR